MANMVLYATYRDIKIHSNGTTFFTEVKGMKIKNEVAAEVMDKIDRILDGKQ